jgi:hypothetical protein
MAAPDAPSAGSAPAGTAAEGEGASGAVGRLRAAWRRLDRNQRLAGGAALALLGTLFLPWYQTSTTVSRVVGGRLQASTARDVQTGIEAFTFVEAAILLVVFGVLLLLFARGERRGFHLPGGDGAIITLAGTWAALLIVWRLFDKPELGRGVAVKLQWGMALAMGAALLLALAGARVRRAHIPEPPIREAERCARRRDRSQAEDVGGERPWLAETEPLPARTPRPAAGEEAETIALPGEVPRPDDPPEPPARRR